MSWNTQIKSNQATVRKGQTKNQTKPNRLNQIDLFLRGPKMHAGRRAFRVEDKAKSSLRFNEFSRCIVAAADLVIEDLITSGVVSAAVPACPLLLVPLTINPLVKFSCDSCLFESLRSEEDISSAAFSSVADSCTFGSINSLSGISLLSLARSSWPPSSSPPSL